MLVGALVAPSPRHVGSSPRDGVPYESGAERQPYVQPVPSLGLVVTHISWPLDTNRVYQMLVADHALYEEMRKTCEFQALKVDAVQSFLANILNSTRDCGSDELINSIAPPAWYAAAQDRGTSEGTIAFPVVNPSNFISPALGPLPSSSSSAAPQIAVLPSSGSSSQVEDDLSVEQEQGGEVRDGGVPIDEEEEGEAAVDAQDAPPAA